MDLQSNNRPWKEKGISKNARLFARAGLYIISFMTCFWTAASVFFVINPSRKTGNFWDDTFPYILLVALVVGLFSLSVKLFQISLAPISFSTSYDRVDSRRLGEPFEVWYQDSLLTGNATSFRDVLTFQADGILVPVTDKQRRKRRGILPYKKIKDVLVKGRYIKFEIVYDVNKWDLFYRVVYRPKIAFYVSEADGERMYRELKRHFPLAVSQYIL